MGDCRRLLIINEFDWSHGDGSNRQNVIDAFKKADLGEYDFFEVEAQIKGMIIINIEKVWPPAAIEVIEKHIPWDAVFVQSDVEQYKLERLRHFQID